MRSLSSSCTPASALAIVSASSQSSGVASASAPFLYSKNITEHSSTLDSILLDNLLPTMLEGGIIPALLRNIAQIVLSWSLTLVTLHKSELCHTRLLVWLASHLLPRQNMRSSTTETNCDLHQWHLRPALDDGKSSSRWSLARVVFVVDNVTFAWLLHFRVVFK